MNTIRLTLIIALSLFVGLADSALAGAPGSGGRIENLDALCQGGSSSGLSCGGGADCPGGRCQITRSGARRRPITVKATIVIDDQTGEWNEDEEEDDIHTVSIQLQFVAQGKRRIVAQNYMNVKGATAEELIANMKQGVEIADLPNSDRRLDEALAAAAVRDGGIIDDFLFQRADSRMEAAMRHYFKTTGDFVVLRTAGIKAFSNNEDNPLATVIEAKLFVAVTPED
ncbi:MAG: hypothetical protein P8R42_19800 [Candidatus Binatia bacterium]|nr:hypothetical protein [Candidatus Binatia bacterium]